MTKFVADLTGVQAIADALRVSASVTKILVDGNRLRDEGTIILCDALRESTVSKVEELSLYNNEIGPDGAKAIAALCTVCASLTQVLAFPLKRAPAPCVACSFAHHRFSCVLMRLLCSLIFRRTSCVGLTTEAKEPTPQRASPLLPTP